jgi:hypothetical protein
MIAYYVAHYVIYINTFPVVARTIQVDHSKKHNEIKYAFNMFLPQINLYRNADTFAQYNPVHVGLLYTYMVV